MSTRGTPEWREAISKGMQGRHSTRGNPKLSEAQRERIATLYADGATPQQIADRFSLSIRHAYLLRKLFKDQQR